MPVNRRGFLTGLIAVAVAATAPIVSVAKWAQSRWVNVRHYGARGDGITDDSAAFAIAVHSLEDGGAIYVPAGAYRVDILNINRGAPITGDGVSKTTIVAKQLNL